MSRAVEIDVEWQDSPEEPRELRHTAAALRIIVAGKSATRVEDGWSKSVRDRVYVSAYPLALWFASEWWWLRWEPAPKGQDRATAWRMAHEMLAAGSGYLWPRLTFECDGERVCVTALRSDITASEPIGFIEAFKKWILVGDFESEID